jgi:hypothetical protein
VPELAPVLLDAAPPLDPVPPEPVPLDPGPVCVLGEPELEPPEPPLPRGLLFEPPPCGLAWVAQPIAPAPAKMATNKQHEVRWRLMSDLRLLPFELRMPWNALDDSTVRRGERLAMLPPAQRARLSVIAYFSI